MVEEIMSDHKIYLLEVIRAFRQPVFICETKILKWPDNWPYTMIGEVSSAKLQCILKLDATQTVIVCDECMMTSRYLPDWYKDLSDFERCREEA
jgi:hypothetical protein